MVRRWDWLLFINILAIGSISLSVIFAINRSLALTQSFFWVIGIFVLYVVSRINYKDLIEIGKPLYVLSIILLLLLFFIADPVRGSIRWFDFGFFRIQPSEIAKAATVILLSTVYLSRNARNIKNLALGLIIAIVPGLLVLVEPDIGNSLAFFAIWFGVSFASGMKLKDIAILFVVGALILFTSYEFLAPYQKDRLTTFIDPLRDPLGTGYNIIQAKIAIGSGGFFGKGLSQGSQSQLNFLPEAESDFIFASIAEQLGFVGSGLLITLYMIMIARCINTAKNVEKAAQLLIVAIVSFLLVQFTVNVGMNLGILPVTGITFPLVSYGGSSLITTLFLLGLVFSIKRFSLGTRSLI